MRIILIFTAIFLASINSYGQKAKWQKVNQSGYGMKYELPDDWEIDGFKTSSVCHCSGTINSVDRFSKNEIGRLSNLPLVILLYTMACALEFGIGSFKKTKRVLLLKQKT
jgi:hypothetical protein